MDQLAVIEATRRWIVSIVIGLNLCPFARRVLEGDKIRYVVSDATEATTLLDDLRREAEFLAATPIATIETTLLIHPHVLNDFLTYNDFLDDAERSLKRQGLDGILQIASFHPDYQFADTTPDAIENYTNRSPYPMLHLLREESITAVVDNPDVPSDIPERNIDTLRKLGKAKLQALLRG